MNITEYQNYHETKTHTNSTFPYTTYLCSIPLDFSEVPLHWHEEIELIVIKKGRGNVSVDLHIETVTAGDIIFILPGQLHSIEQKARYTMEYENIIFKKELFLCGEDDLCANQFILPLLDSNHSALTFITPAFPGYTETSDCIRQIDESCASRPNGYQLLVKSCLFRFFFLLISAQKNRDSVSSIKTKSLEKLKTILKYVEEHYSEAITIEVMASITFYSKSHFMKFFKSHMGLGFTQYLNDYRLTMAARLLVTGSSNILEVAVATGFDNLSYFNRLFKRKYTQSPTEYRRTSSTASGTL